MILAPLVRGRRGAHRDVLETIQKAGFVRARIDGVIYPIDEIPKLAAQKLHDIEAVVDRLVIRDGIDARLGESVRLAARHGEGVVTIVYQAANGRLERSDGCGRSVCSTRVTRARVAARASAKSSRARSASTVRTARAQPVTAWELSISEGVAGVEPKRAPSDEVWGPAEPDPSHPMKLRTCAPIAMARDSAPKLEPAGLGASRFTKSPHSP